MASEEDANLFVSDSAGTNSLSIPTPLQVFDLRPSVAAARVVREGEVVSISWVRTIKGGVVRITGRGLRLGREK